MMSIQVMKAAELGPLQRQTKTAVTARKNTSEARAGTGASARSCCQL
jgi:hypothetical protein